MGVHLVKGNDAVLVGEAVTNLVDGLLDGRERAEVLEEFRGDEYGLGAVVMSASTVSMFGDRVVVARELGRFAARELDPLVALLRSQPPEVSLVLVWEKPVGAATRATPVPKALAEAVADAGGTVVDASLPSGRARNDWAQEQFEQAPVTLDASARHLVLEVLGDDLHRLGGLLEVLSGAYPGHGGALGEAEVVPFLGEAGGVPPWELTDAIDAGRIDQAVDRLRRMLGAGDRHPLQVMVTLQSHYERMLRLDGSGATDEKAAAAALGMKGSTFPAKKALVQGTRLGAAKVARAVQLLAAADVDLRGATALPAEAVLELLVARLAALSASAGRAGARGGPPARRRS